MESLNDPKNVIGVAELLDGNNILDKDKIDNIEKEPTRRGLSQHGRKRQN